MTFSATVWTVVVASVFAFLAVEIVVLRAAFRHGRPRGLELAWLATPAVVLLVLVGWTGTVLGGDVRLAGEPDLRVHVVGKMFRWEIRHEVPGPDGKMRVAETLNRLHLPAGKTAEIVLSTGDVAHGFWVPQLRVKQDAFPGLPVVFRVKPGENGEFNIVCSELCGVSHYAMRGFVHVESQADFDAWVAENAEIELAAR